MGSPLPPCSSFSFPQSSWFHFRFSCVQHSAKMSFSIVVPTNSSTPSCGKCGPYETWGTGLVRCLPCGLVRSTTGVIMGRCTAPYGQKSDACHTYTLPDYPGFCESCANKRTRNSGPRARCLMEPLGNSRCTGFADEGLQCCWPCENEQLRKRQGVATIDEKKTEKNAPVGIHLSGIYEHSLIKWMDEFAVIARVTAEPAARISATFCTVVLKHEGDCPMMGASTRTRADAVQLAARMCTYMKLRFVEPIFKDKSSGLVTAFKIDWAPVSAPISFTSPSSSIHSSTSSTSSESQTVPVSSSSSPPGGLSTTRP